MADFNKIFVNSPLSVTQLNSAMLCFSDGFSLPRTNFSIEGSALHLSNDALDFISTYYGYDSARIYEYHSALVEYNTILSGRDVFGNLMKNLPLNQDFLMVFVNGVLLSQDSYAIIDQNSIQVFVNLPSNQQNVVQIYVSNISIYKGKLPITTVYDPEAKVYRSSIQKYDIPYNRDTTLFFKNGQLIKFSDILEVTSRGYVNTTIGVLCDEKDTLEYFVLDDKVSSLHFIASPGYVDYYNQDYYNHQIPTLYTTTVGFNDAASLLIDNIRQGFIIREVKGNGCLVMIGPDFDSSTVNCEQLVAFSSPSYEIGEYYVEVPDCRSIVEYLSDFDKQYKLLPEVLAVLQKVILKEVYDEAIRLKNMRSVTRVDSAYINKFIRFLGFDMDIKRLPLKKRREILEELNSYYRVVGTKNASNYFNMIESDWGIKAVDQLFTYHNSKLPNQREYVDFVRMQDTGAYEEHIEYQYPYIDYGKVSDFVGETLDYGPAIDPDLDPEADDIPEELRDYARHLVEQYYIDITGEDYGWVYTPIRGKWVKWWKFNRPKNLYPTNHVVVDVDMKVGVDATNLLDEFKNKFYNLVSTVLYIHKIIQSYAIGSELSAPTQGNISYTYAKDYERSPQKRLTLAQVHKMPVFGFMAAPAFPIENGCVVNKGDSLKIRNLEEQVLSALRTSLEGQTVKGLVVNQVEPGNLYTASFETIVAGTEVVLPETLMVSDVELTLEGNIYKYIYEE